MTTPWQRYQKDLQREDFSHDVAQEEAVRLLQELYDRLLANVIGRRGGFLGKMRRWRGMPIEPEMGLYFWGGVGRGKTYLVDSFYDCLPAEGKLRMHFHRFMQRVHAELISLEGHRNPLPLVADRLSAQVRVICFDEFFVTDIGDAMILGGLIEALFTRGVTLVATSNIEPSRLYENGLQRQRFLPTIALLEKYTRVVNVDAGVDYRLRTLEKAELYHYPLGEAADASLQRSFEKLALEGARHWERLEINGRYLTCRRVAEDVIWFDYDELCNTPRSQNDYIELSRLYQTVLLSGVPAFRAAMDDQARRFINLVDEFYDRNVKLVVAAEVALPELYPGGQLAFAFERTRSRLEEMQSREYLAREHRP